MELVYHLENPARQPWQQVLASLAPMLGIGIGDTLPFSEWITRIESYGIAKKSDAANPAHSLLDFFEADFERMASGDVNLDTKNSLAASPSLRSAKAISEQLLVAYVDHWQRVGFLKMLKLK
jgi:hypothetical protein